MEEIKSFIMLLCLACWTVNLTNCKEYVINFSSDPENCEDDYSADFLAPDGLKVERIDEDTATLSGNFILKQSLEEGIGLFVAADKYTPAGYERTISMTVNDFCEKLKNKNEDNMVASFIRKVNFPDECPVSPGTFFVDKMSANMSQFSLSAATEGKYKLILKFFTEDDTEEPGYEEENDLVCLTSEVAVEPIE